MPVRLSHSVVVTVTLMAALVSPLAAQMSVREGVMAQYQQLNVAVKARDAAAVAAFYVPDAEMTQAGVVVRTREGVEQMWRQAFSRGVASFEPTSQDADRQDSVVTERGIYVMKKATGEAVSKGTYAATWRRDGGQWRIARLVLTPAEK